MLGPGPPGTWDACACPHWEPGPENQGGHPHLCVNATASTALGIPKMGVRSGDSPGWRGSVDQAKFHTAKGHWFNSPSGHM